MLTNNPFAELALIVPSVAMQYFVIAMILLVIISTVLDMIHKKNVVYFFRNAKKAKKSAKLELSAGKKTAVILKTVATDIATTSELGMGKRRLAHVLGMYGTILFWIASVILIFREDRKLVIFEGGKDNNSGSENFLCSSDSKITFRAMGPNLCPLHFGQILPFSIFQA